MGGAERVAINLAKIFSKKRHPVKIISLFKSNRKTFFGAQGIDVVYLSEVGCAYTDNLFSKIKTFLILRDFYKKNIFFGSEFIISTFPILSIFSILLFKGNLSRLIASEHSSYFAHNFFIRFLRVFYYRKNVRVITLTRNDSILFSKHNIKASFIPNPVINFPINRKVAAKRKKIHCLSVGRLHKDKGFDRLIDIANELRDENIIFTIVGSGSEKLNLKRKIIELKLTQSVKIINASNDIEKFYFKSDIYLLTSRTEAFAMVLLEAMSFGLPIISFDCPVGPREIIRDNYNGFLIKDGSTKQFAEHVKLLISNKPLFNKMSTNALKSAKNYSPDTIYSLWAKYLN